MSSVRDTLRGAAFIGRAVLSDALTYVGARLRPEPEQAPEWLTEIRRDVAAADAAAIPEGAREGSVTLSPVAQQLVADGAHPVNEAIDGIADAISETSIKPLRGSRAWRELHGDRR